MSAAPLISGLGIYALVAAGYTVLIPVMFRDPIFSEQNSKSALSIASAHTVFLAIAFEFTWLAVRIYPFLPDWMTKFHRSGSFFAILCLGVAAILAAVERPRIYLASGPSDPNLTSRRSEDIDSSDELNRQD